CSGPSSRVSATPSAPEADGGAPPNILAFGEGGTSVEIDLGAPCDAARTVQSDGSALVVRDEEVLARFPLERILGRIIGTAGGTISPTELLQRIFDTENTSAGGAYPDGAHCDDPKDSARPLAGAVSCPRAEGSLARSGGFFLPGDADYFAPVALVNRFDLT